MNMKKTKIIVWSGIFVLVMYVISCVMHNTILFADGNYVAINMLDTGQMYLYDPMRNFGLFIRQVFAWTYLQMFPADRISISIFVKLLAFGYSFWTSFYYGLAVVRSYKKKNSMLLYFTVCLFTVQIIFSGFNLVLESILAGAVFWYILCFFMTYTGTEKKEKLLVILSLVLAGKIYASFMFFAIILLIVIILRFKRERIAMTKFAWTSIFLLGGDFFVSIYFVFTTKMTDARSGLISSISIINKHFFVFAIGALVCVVFWYLEKRSTKVRLVKLFAIMQYILAVGLILAVMRYSEKYASLNFPSRSLNIVLPLLTACLVVIFDKMNYEGKNVNECPYGLLAGLVISCVIFINLSANSYDNYLKKLLQITSNQEGFVECTEYRIENDSFFTTWTIPYESIMAQAVYNDGVYISSIIVMPQEWNTTGGVASDNLTKYPDLSRYRIWYNSEAFN